MFNTPENLNYSEARLQQLEQALAEKERIILQKDEIIKQQAAELERLSLDLEDVSGILEDSLEKHKLDPVTKLESRNAFMSRVNNVLDSRLGISMRELRGEEEWQKHIEHIFGDKEKMKELSEVHIAFGDVSFLSVANRGGRHDQGDKTLLDVASGVKEKTVGAGRLSGDEYAAIIKGSEEEVAEKIRDIEVTVGAIEAVPNLKNNKLDLNIDFGTAGLDEAISIFRHFESQDLEKRSGPRQIKRELGDIWLTIADKRSSLRKAQSRLALLMDRRIAGDANLTELVKGAYNIDQDTIDLFIEREKGGESRERIIRDFINYQEEKEIASEKSEYLRKKAELIWELVEDF